MQKKRKNCAGFTLAELLVALMIMAIVLAAAATMADALACGKETNDRMSRDTASLLQIQTRLSDLIMRANGIIGIVEAGDQRIVLWHDNNGDGIAAEDDSEYTTIEMNSDLVLVVYKNNDSSNQEIYGNWKIETITVVNDKLVTVKFDLTENSVETYQICAAPRGGVY